MSMFQKATKTQAKLRAALLGPAGSGKTYTALKVGRALVGPNGKIALMDTEHGSASKYADLFSFDTVAPDEFSVDTYIEIIAAAGAAGYDLLILDSLSHAWAGKGGLLEFVDNFAKRNSGNSFGAWRDATPKHNDLVEAMLACPCHLIVTMRVKMEHVVEKDERGRTQIRKVGLQPVQRDGLEYEFDVVGDLTSDNDLSISKTRCPALKGKMFREPGEDIAAILRTWLSSGAAEAPKVPSFTPAKPVAPAPTSPPKPLPATQVPSTNLATPAQVRAIYAIGHDHADLSEDEIDERSMALFGVEPPDLSRKQASDFITSLKGQPPPTPDVSPPVAAVNGDSITPSQLRAIYTIGRNEHRFTDPETDENCIAVFGVRPSELSKQQASTFITNMQSKAQA